MKVKALAMDEGDSRRHRHNPSVPFKGKAGMGMGYRESRTVHPAPRTDTEHCLSNNLYYRHASD